MDIILKIYDKLPPVEKCCCCVPLKAGSIVIAVWICLIGLDNFTYEIGLLFIIGICVKMNVKDNSKVKDNMTFSGLKVFKDFFLVLFKVFIIIYNFISSFICRFTTNLAPNSNTIVTN